MDEDVRSDPVGRIDKLMQANPTVGYAEYLDKERGITVRVHREAHTPSRLSEIWNHAMGKVLGTLIIGIILLTAAYYNIPAVHAIFTGSHP